ncbi:MAG: hypothetical protein GY938_13985 [Ketobacter sp.]|nr:hypothetical protein [Ketobacter sp.]
MERYHSPSICKQAVLLMLRPQPKYFTCHSIDQLGNNGGPGPQLNNIGTVAVTRIPGLSAREYSEQSIVDPGAYIVPECPAPASTG